MSNGINLVDLFQTAAGALQSHRSELNQADDHNQNHGDNMVAIFEVITEALKAKEGSDPADQLEYAAQLLRRNANSGSAAAYAQGLDRASRQLGGGAITADKALGLLQTLMNGAQEEEAPAEPAADLGGLLGGLLGGDDAELDTGDLLNAGLSFLQSKQEGDSNVEALAEAFVSGTAMGQSSHRSQSGQLVTNAVLQMLSSQLNK